MKNLFLSLVVVALTFSSVSGQYIQQLNLIPPQPVSSGPVSIIADLMFSSGDCRDKTVLLNQLSATEFSGYAIHCLGVLSVICYDSDTFNLGILPPGNYSFSLQLDAGYGVTPCTPGIVPGPIDSINFVVTASSGLDEKGEEQFVVYPNPSNDRFNFTFYNEFTGKMSIYALDGKELISFKVADANSSIDVSGLAPGVYLAEFLSVTNKRSYKLIYKIDQ